MLKITPKEIASCLLVPSACGRKSINFGRIIDQVMLEKIVKEIATLISPNTIGVEPISLSEFVFVLNPQGPTYSLSPYV